MKKTTAGIFFGIIAGVFDTIPMIAQGLSWDAIISAFSMWVIIGFLLTRVALKVPPSIKGICISFLVLFPSAVLIGWKEPISLIPIVILTTFLGSMLGYTVDKYSK